MSKMRKLPERLRTMNKYFAFNSFVASFLIPVLGMFGRKYIGSFSGIIGTLSFAVSAGISLLTAYNYFFGFGKSGRRIYNCDSISNILAEVKETLSINMGILLDPISVMMIVVVTSVSLMVHIFSLGYMKGEERYATYYSFLSLFTFSMLGLVLATNIFQTYIFGNWLVCRRSC